MKPLYGLLALLCPATNLLAQSTFNGRVHTAPGSPLVSVNITLRGSGEGTLTGNTGAFSLRLLQPRDTLLVSALGFVPYEQPVTAASGFLDITLEETTGELDEVVVIGYGTTTRRIGAEAGEGDDLSATRGNIDMPALSRRLQRYGFTLVPLEKETRLFFIRERQDENSIKGTQP